MSYMLLNEDEELIEGIQYITKISTEYDQDKFIDYKTNFGGKEGNYEQN
jgi:hypothetical protein